MSVVVTREWKSWPQDINGTAIDGGTTSFVLTLPRATGVTAKIATRALTEKIIEVFKHRIHTDDAAFDAALHVSTDTPDATRAFLVARPALRAFLVDTITALRPFELHDTVATLRLPQSLETDPRVDTLVSLLDP